MADQTSTTGPQRFKLIPPENLTPEQRVLADAIRSADRSSGRCAGPSPGGEGK